MSLNWREINLILGELELDGYFIQNIVQPDFSRLLIELFKMGSSRWLHICLKAGLTRLHWDDAPGRSRSQQPRFAELLRSRLKGHRIIGVSQIAQERIVRIDAQNPSESLKLYIRLWSNAANILLVDSESMIVDAFYRRPEKNESSGNFWVEEIAGKTNAREFTIREWDSSVFDGFGSFIRSHYGDVEKQAEFESIRQRLNRLIPPTTVRLEKKVESLRSQIGEASKSERFKEMAEIILGNKHRIGRADLWLDAEDWYNPGSRVRIELDPKLDSQENADKYFQKFRKARDARKYLDEDLTLSEIALNRFRALSESIGNLNDADSLQRLAKELEPYFETRPGQKEKDDSERPGLQFSVNGYPIFVGRSASESDELLRKHVRGNDYWLHIRDRPGGYVFVKVSRGKTIPLEILLDAATLAVWYSKARGEPEVDLFYTQVKHLRRAKHGTLGTVIPTQEKNIHLVVEQHRLDKLKSLGIA